VSDVATAKKRMAVMVAVDVVCVLAAIVSITLAFKLQQSWLLGVFAAALLVGFGAQIWFIAGFARAKQGV
jgi:hypothetical protein